MFQLALRLRGMEVEQDADAARQPVGHGDFRGASSGTSCHPRAAPRRAGYSAVRSGDDVKIGALHVLGLKAVRSSSARSSSAVAWRIASLVFARAVVAPRRPRRILVMAWPISCA